MIDDNEIPVDDQPLFNEASLGIEAEKFVNSPVGTFIVEKADRLLNESFERLVKTKANMIGEIQDAQVDARVAVKIKEWLTEMIISGHVAEQQLIASAEINQ